MINPARCSSSNSFSVQWLCCCRAFHSEDNKRFWFGYVLSKNNSKLLIYDLALWVWLNADGKHQHRSGFWLASCLNGKVKMHRGVVVYFRTEKTCFEFLEHGRNGNSRLHPSHPFTEKLSFVFEAAI